MKLLFWSSSGIVIYVYILYPVMMGLLSRWSSVALPNSRNAVPDLPSLTVIIPAYNEERWIERKIQNTLAVNYPRNRMQIFVASDGSTDKTADIARHFCNQGVDVVHFPERAGKRRTLNRAVSMARGDVIVITDANAMLEPDALRWVVPHFENSRLGGVAGNRLCFSSDTLSSEGEGLYWRYESWMKRSESRRHSCLGAYGQLYAIRRELFPYVSAVSDDFSIPMKMIISTGSRVVFEPRALARIPAAANLEQEWQRKVRSHLAVLHDLPHLKAGLNPLTSPIWWEFWSHQVLRMLVPWAMLVALAVSPWLWKTDAILRCLVSAQALFYLGALLGLILTRHAVRWKPLYVCFYFVFANLAVGAAWLRWLRGTSPYAWMRTERILPRALPSAGESRGPTP